MDARGLMVFLHIFAEMLLKVRAMKIKMLIVLAAVILSLAFAAMYFILEGDHPQEEPGDKTGPLPAIIIPKDYSAWRSEFGAGLPDPSSPEGIRKALADAERLPRAQSEFMELLRSLPCVYTNESAESVRHFLSQVETVLSGFGRAGSAEILKMVQRDAGNSGLSVALLQSDELSARVIERYCLVFGRFADLLWERAGEEFAAAEVDNGMLHALVKMRAYCTRRSWRHGQDATDKWLEAFKECRCDSVKSNFCRAHLKCERDFDAFFKEPIENGQVGYRKVTDRFYRWHLNSARKILRREPKWSPNFKAK